MFIIVRLESLLLRRMHVLTTFPPGGNKIRVLGPEFYCWLSSSCSMLLSWSGWAFGSCSGGAIDGAAV